MLPVEQPFKTYTGLDGKPLDNGYVYFGQPNQNPQTNPVTVYWDAAGTIPAAQPLRTVNGYILRAGTPANVFFDGAYSELVLDSKKRQVFYAKTSDEFSIASLVQRIFGAAGASFIGFIQAGMGAVKQTVQDVLRERVSITSYGGVGDSVTNNNAAFAAAEAVADEIYLPKGEFLVTSTLKKDYYGPGKIKSTGVSLLAFSGSGFNDLTVAGDYAGAYPIQVAIAITSVADAAVTTTGFSASSGQGTITFGGSKVYPVGSWVEIVGLVTSSGAVSGRFPVFASAPGSITIRTTATGTQTSAGTIQDFDTFKWSYNGGATWQTTYDDYDPPVDHDIQLLLTCNTWSISLAPQNTTRLFAFQGLSISFGVSRGHAAGARWDFSLNPPAACLSTSGNSIKFAGKRLITFGDSRSIGIGAGTFGNLNSIGTENIAIGVDALKNNTQGYANTAIGAAALGKNETGGANVAIGATALNDNVAGSDNVAIGLYSQYTTTGRENVSVGVDSLRQNRGGYNNTAIGSQAMYSVENGVENVAVGLYALRGGTESLPTGITNVSCTAVGVRSLQLATNTNGNTGIGLEALYNTTGSFNTALGMDAGFKHVGGNYNVFIGYNAGNNTSQAAAPLNSIAIGDSSYVTGSNAVAIGSGAVGRVNAVTLGNAFHSQVSPGADNATSSGAPSFRWSVVYAGTGSINTSDENAKEQIHDIEAAVLRAWSKVKYQQYKFRDAVAKKEDRARWHFGVIAQRVKEAFESEGLDAFSYGLLCYDTLVDGSGRYGIRYEEALVLECAYLRSLIAK